MDPKQDPSDIATLNLKEGPAMNFFKALHEQFGGEITGDSYRVENATVRIRLNSYEAGPGMEILISEAWYEKDLIQDRQPDGDMDSVHIYLVLEGATSQSFQDRDETLAAGTLKGAFAYNGLFPMRVLHPAKQGLLSISLKIHKETVKALLPEAFDLFTEMFSDPEGVAYHAQIPSELEKLCKELYHYRDVEFGNRSMVIARGI